MSTRDQLIERMARQLSVWSGQLDRLVNELRAADPERQSAVRDLLGRLSEQQAAFALQIARLQEDGAAPDDLQHRLEQMAAAWEAAFSEALRRISG